MSLSSVQLRDEIPKVDLSKVMKMVHLPEWKVFNIYMYGSRVYGTNRNDSDLDLMVVANSMDIEKEIKNREYNIHIITPDQFEDCLWSYRMVELECIYAPLFAVIQERKDLKSKFSIDKNRMKKHILTQSHNSWIKAKLKLRDCDIERGTKSLFHSLRILLFGLQMAEEGEIFDFSEANYYWEEIDNSECFEWTHFKDLYLPRKKGLEKMLIEA